MRAVQAALDDPRQFAQTAITELVTVVVVIALEKIDIDHDQRQRNSTTTAAFPFGLEREIEFAAVCYPGEAINHCRVAQQV